ncbi:ABC transporter ATP-binding protein [Methylocapsa sp. D3K7]|uniref:ABC transporter ATP-binding protein n=1 Tax=Methylocapsa sp. D3K7 TaxID=3041435 RepID=UPI00244EB1AA|nr:ABC transporter ATP-binding protein [Methylocapsa sp. D3K7]WGJ13683.1 ABC transporter ATP-binding protein [Methylocapsa sp. D3K7]
MIELRNVWKTFGGAPAVSDLSLKIESGAFFVLAGPSGCGKSTVLRMINALIAPDKGDIFVRGENVQANDLEKLRRGIGYVIQSAGLFPHWTVADNILAVPRLLKWSPSQCAARLDEVAALLRIDLALLNRYPRQLSGGQQQRIGIARALAADPDMILMDEPFAALDPVSRAALQDELRAIHARGGKTIVFVTHDMDEALRLATGMAVMRNGQLVQTGDPASILLTPADDFVREFVGGENLQLRLLDLMPVRKLLKPGKTRAIGTIAADASLKTALNLMLANRSSVLGVEDTRGVKLGEVTLDDILARRDGG